ncbi:hypothetical protein AnigIFM63604_009810 [Aspergillus niger]|uniref:AAA+ ATPase domain-containing protein n=1 Tax=Aspergillus niger TaxID=5061 RepID=A0A9W5ZU46_ASPNG|nr:hypothetical protein AnigIFM63604_009810 [Aspergillus niger]
MAMGQGEQRAIHPFFRRELGIATGPIGQTPVSNHSYEGPELLHKQSPSNHVPPLSSCPEPSATPVATLDHDPNASRRKRRKTDNEKSDPTSSGQGSVMSYVISKDARSSQDKDTPSAETESAITAEDGPGPQEPKADTESATPASEGLDATKQEPDHQESAVGVTNEPVAERRSPRQKTIKLNPNGKLLASPVAVKFEDKPKKTRASKRSKVDSQKLAGLESKIVIIRYGMEGNAREQVGKLVNEILAGQKKHETSKKVSQPVAPASSTVAQQPQRPTHPFFLKKPTRKPDTIDSQCREPDTTNSQPSAGTGLTARPFPGQDTASAAVPSTTFTSFKHRRSRFPEPIQPIWPPRDLVHVRGIEHNTRNTATSEPVVRDLKKAKMAAISIHDNESVLVHQIRKYSSDSPQSLRIPSRHVASGKVIQTAVTRQLSASSHDKKTLMGACHPALKRLHSSLPCSMTPFDQGAFETLNWTQKYAPQSADQVLQTSKEAYMLRDWLKFLMVTTVDTGKSSKGDEKSRKSTEEKKRKRRKKENLDGFIVSSEDEAYELDPVNESDDELAGDVTTKRTLVRSNDWSLSSKSGADRARVSNAILLSGPPGCGKTASVYAVAKELDFEVFEINPGNRRSARDIVERVGDMTRNHLVHNAKTGEVSAADAPVEAPADDKQNKLMGFFKSSAAKDSKQTPKVDANSATQVTDIKRSRNQKQSLILLEEADILFEEDKQFWSGVMTLINQSKRPIIITCNDENLIPLQDIGFHAILRYRAPPLDLAVDYTLLLAANEGHMLKRNAVEDLYAGNGRDLRRTVMELGFWCQIAVGSEKSGLDWIIDRWPRGSDLDQNGDPLRVLSLNTYEPHMGWFSRDILMCNGVDADIETQHEAFNWWQLSTQESESMADAKSNLSKSPLNPVSATTNTERIDQLRQASEFMDMKSDLDILGSCCSIEAKLDVVDTSAPSMTEKQRSNYAEGYTLLDTSLVPDYSQTQTAIACTFEVLLGRAFRRGDGQDEAARAAQVLENVAKPDPANTSEAGLLSAFAPIMRADHVFPAPTGRLAPSFENGLAPIAEDLGPYIRGIMSYDMRLAQYRHLLTGALSEDQSGTKRGRQTRASRAALEGGSKAHTRKERWFASDANPSLILATGKQEWQDVLVQKGYFAVPSGGESMPECHEQASESSSEGGI